MWLRSVCFSIFTPENYTCGLQGISGWKAILFETKSYSWDNGEYSKPQYTLISFAKNTHSNRCLGIRLLTIWHFSSKYFFRGNSYCILWNHVSKLQHFLLFSRCFKKKRKKILILSFGEVVSGGIWSTFLNQGHTKSLWENSEDHKFQLSNKLL